MNRPVARHVVVRDRDPLPGHEQQIFTAYLKKLASWQSAIAFSSGRVPYETDWGPLLGSLIRAKNA